MRKLFKTTSILAFTAAFLAGSALVPFLSGASAGATEQPAYTFQVRNVSDSGTFEGAANSVDLDAGEIAQMRMQVGNTEEGNDISSLRFKAFFNDQAGPTEFHADIKADELPWVGGVVNVSVPSGYFLEYVPASTVLDKDDRPEFFTRTNIDDVNGTSPLAFNDGMNVTNVVGDPHSWLWVYFKVKAVEQAPVVINPRLDLTKYVANLSDGESFANKKTQTTAGPGEKVAFQVMVKNGVAESTLHNLIVSDQKPAGNKTPQTLIASVTSDEASDNRLVRVNITSTQEINLISGSVVIKDLWGNTIKTLSKAEEDKLFGKGLSLGDVHGTFEYGRIIEYKAKTSEVKEIPPVTQLPDTGPGAVVLLLLSSVPVGLALRALKKKI